MATFLSRGSQKKKNREIGGEWVKGGGKTSSCVGPTGGRDHEGKPVHKWRGRKGGKLFQTKRENYFSGLLRIGQEKNRGNVASPCLNKNYPPETPGKDNCQARGGDRGRLTADKNVFFFKARGPAQKTGEGAHEATLFYLNAFLARL